VKKAVDLLGLDYVFGQLDLLSHEGFITAAKERGVDLEIGHLEALHRNGYLTPLFRVHLGRETIVKDTETGGYLLPRPRISVDGLRELRAEGRLHIPSSEAFQPWHTAYATRGRTTLWVDRYYYSHWHLLALHEVSVLLRDVRRRGRARFGSTYRLTTQVAMSTPITEGLVIALSALEPVYYPDLAGVVKYAGDLVADYEKWFADYLGWVRDRKATDVLEWLGLRADQVVEWADGILGRTTFFDPTRSWVDIVRLFAPDKWAATTGNVRLAIDHRLAAEMLLKLHDDLAATGAAPRLPDPPPHAWTPQHERFNRPLENLDRILTEYGISPHPSLVIALEGRSEVILAEKTMSHLNIPKRRSYIELIDIGGNTKDYGLLAGYVATPELGKPIQSNLVRLDRPVTRFMVVTDPENKLRTQAGRDKKKREIVDSIFGRLPAGYRTAQARAELESLVSVVTWTADDSLEFAHFTNGQIASAIKALYRKNGRPVPILTAADVDVIRRRRGNLKGLLKRLPGPVIRKDEMAEALWPALQAKLDRARAKDSLDAVPMGRILKQAVELATTSLRRNNAFKV
jgi:hypothetical protein